MKTRIAIADDHPVVRKGLSEFFSDEPDLEVVAQCADGSELLDVLDSVRPDVIVADLRMPRVGGLELLRRLASQKRDVPVILIAANITDDDVIEAMRLGVKGVVLKEMASTLLVQSIRKVAAGGVWLEKESVARAMNRILDSEFRGAQARQILSPREMDVVQLLAEGLGNRQIADRLCVTEGTVKSHLHTIYEKTGVKGRLQLLNYANEHGLTRRS